MPSIMRHMTQRTSCGSRWSKEILVDSQILFSCKLVIATDIPNGCVHTFVVNPNQSACIY